MLDFNGKPTQAKLANGETWTVKLADPRGAPLQEGDRLVVTAITGSTAIVAPAERTITE